jgi:multiple sugar transport system ATP-binding protein
MSVAENLGFSMKLRKVSHTEIAVRVNQVAHTLGISHLLDAKPKALSGGQRQRVAMGRAMIREPEVFLFDEPLSNLDAQLRTQMRTEIKKLHQDLRTTMVYVTHDQVEAMTLADRIVVLKEGEIQQIGTPMEVYQRPQNHFVASFMGSPSMNFIPGVHCAHSIQSPLLSKRLLISAWGQALSLLENQEIWIAFRPEHLILGRIENAWNFRAKVRVIEPLGAEMLVSFELVESAGETLWGQLKATGIGYKGPYDSNLRVGRVLDLSCPFKDVHFFDRASGVRAS